MNAAAALVLGGMVADATLVLGLGVALAAVAVAATGFLGFVSMRSHPA